VYLWAALWLLGNTCCTSIPSDSHAQIPAQSKESPRERIDKVSHVTEMNESSWNVLRSKVESPTDFETIYFQDAAQGWIGGEGAMYKTSDGGHTWERGAIDIPAYTTVADIVFNGSLGWVVLQKRAPDLSSFQENQVQLMQTRDGGQHWQPQYVSKRLFVTRIRFFSEQEGWLTGLKYVGTGPFDTALFVLYTSNQGKDWVDVSEDLNRIAVNEKGFVIGWIEDIIAESPLTATVLTSRGHLFRTDNGGQNWRQLDDKLDQFLYMSACCLGFKSDKLPWIAGGQSGTEGTMSLLALQQSHDAWQKYYLDGVHLRDVLYLSEKEIFACGSSFPKGSLKSLVPMEGVILVSTDGGQNWSIIYRDTKIKSINALSAINHERILAVGDDGLVIRIEPALRNQNSSQKGFVHKVKPSA
jgi:photosystem II stability/assembly factor-like uncharacterized protein